VSLVAILDADKEGFLRNSTSLIQTFGRAARNIDGMIIMYADTITDSMRNSINETGRRRAKQIDYNIKNEITPQSIIKAIPDRAGEMLDEYLDVQLNTKSMTRLDLVRIALDIESTMKKYAEDLDFENAIKFRDKLTRIKSALGEPVLSEVG
jgi:excinuclease ABC subunit B